MFYLTEVLYTYLPIIAASLLGLIIIGNLYLKIRKQFPISVNCWFCNSWTKVPYTNRDGFDCPTCSQYNGFTQDGDYNKIIPEQHDSFLNKKQAKVAQFSGPASNGLCKLCNNNQQLKIFQLAHFVPLSEDNYDAEIEHFEAQLEKAYNLCKKCDRVLKTTIGHQNAWIFGNKLKKMCINGFSTIGASVDAKTGLPLAIFVNFIRICAVFLTLFGGLVVFASSKYAMKLLPQFYINLLENIMVSVKIGRYNIAPLVLASFLGIFLQIIAIIAEKSAATTKINRLLCWTIVLLTHWVSNGFAFQILVIWLFCLIYLLSTTFAKQELAVKSSKKMRNRQVHKFIRNLENTCSEVSDFEDVSASTSAFNDLKSSNGSNTMLNSTAASAMSQFTYKTADKSAISSQWRSNLDSELNSSLNRLNLGFKPPQVFSAPSVFCEKRPKPVLSPAKFVNSWVNNGGFLPTRNLSRSSSESSGFGSQINENPFSAETVYTNANNSIFRNNNTFYPSLNQNNLLFIGSGGANRSFVTSPNQFSSRFSSISGQDEFRFNREVGTSGLFKNWPEMGTRSVRHCPTYHDLTANSLFNN